MDRERESAGTMSSIASFFSFGSRNKRSGNSSHKLPPHTAAVGNTSPGKVVRKVLCRYGMGCTHVSDPVHRERFWHPPVPDAADNKHEGPRVYPCHECGRHYQDLSELQLHLKRKTAWSNKSLVGCRISCLVDNREWQEGMVLEFSPMTGKHRVSLEHMGEVRWMQMLRTAFFIVQRQVIPRSEQQQQHGGETKEVEVADPKGLDPSLAPIEQWTYAEDITIDYAKAQALMHRAYGNKIQETGHKTQGHLCVTENDKAAAKDAKSSLLYGELLPRGINKAMMPPRLGGERASVVYELGMGIGKVAMQVFLQFPNLTRVHGVELSEARFAMAEAAALRLCQRDPEEFAVTYREKGRGIHVTNLKSKTVLEMEVGNLLDVKGLEQADIVLLETDLSHTIYPDLCRILGSMKKGARAFTYLDLRKIWALSGCFPFRQLDINRPISDRYATSWSVNRGHHFYLWTKMLDSGCEELDGSLADDPSLLPDELPVAGSTGDVDLFDADQIVYASRDDPRRRAAAADQHHHPHGRRGYRNHNHPPSGADGKAGLPGWMKAFRRFWRGDHHSSNSNNHHNNCGSSSSAASIVAADHTCQPKIGDMESESVETRLDAAVLPLPARA